MRKRFFWYWHRFWAMDKSEILPRIGRAARAPFVGRAFETARAAWKKLPWEGAGFPLLPYPEEAPRSSVASLMEEAEGIMKGDWRVFQTDVIQVAFPPRWRRDYSNGLTVPQARGRKSGALPAGADARCIWEINRFTHITRLAQAAYLGGRTDCASAALLCLDDWAAHHPVGVGWPWKNPLEAAIRLVNLVWIDALLEAANHDASLAEVRKRIMAELVPAHAWWIASRLSFGSSANNHLLGELSSLMMAVRRWPSTHRVSLSLEELKRRLEEQILLQFAEDGGNREQALHYHLFAFELAWQGMKSVPNPERTVMQRLGAAGRFFASVIQHDEPWDYGDSDDATISPWAWIPEKALHEWKDWLAGDTGSGPGFWLGSFAPGNEEIRPGQWKVYPQTGIGVWKTTLWQARFDASPLGYLSLAAHGHLDALHLSLWYKNKAVLIDPGTGSYRAQDEARGILAGRSSHNGPYPLETPPLPRRAGVFLWKGRHADPVLTKLPAGPVEGRLAYPSGAWQRRVEALPMDNGWCILDSRVEGTGAWTVRWMVAPDLGVRQEGDSFLLEREGIRMRLSFKEDGKPVKQATITKAVCSPRYGVILDTLVVEWVGEGDKITTFLEVL